MKHTEDFDLPSIGWPSQNHRRHLFGESEGGKGFAMLIDRTSALTLTAGPATSVMLSNDLLQAIHQFIGLEDEVLVGGELDGSKLRAKTVVSVDPSRRIARRLASLGYTWQRSYFVIRREEGRYIFLPSEDSKLFSAGLRFYVPFRTRGRILKGLVAGMSWVKAERWLPLRLLVASKGALPLAVLSAGLTGENRPFFAWHLNGRGHSRKINLQVMRPNGEILGYIKLSLNEEASRYIQHEASVLTQLWTCPQMRPYIPKTLIYGHWTGSYLLFVSALEGKAAPVAFTRTHSGFLQELSAICPVERPGNVLVNETAKRCEQASLFLQPGWKEIKEEALDKARRLLEGQSVPCGIIHGDFVPENTLTRNGRLLVFDWECSAVDAPIAWDVFHFNLEVAYLLKKKVEKVFSIPQSRASRGSWLLYLLDSARHLSESEMTRNRAIRLQCRRELLCRETARP